MSTVDAPAPTKRCSKCGEVKPLTEFHRDAARRDGRRSECRECHRAAARAAVRAARQARRADGRCQQTGCPHMAEPGRSRCAEHLAANAASTRAAQQSRRAEGRCHQTGCPELHLPDSIYCVAHREADRARKRARRQRNREAGWCYIGGRSHGPATRGVLCDACAARRVAKYRRIMIEFARAMDDLGIDLDTLCPCGQEEVSHVDHIQPDSLNGTDDFENLRFLGAFCNVSRGNRTDWKPATSWLDAPQWSEPPNAFTTE